MARKFSLKDNPIFQRLEIPKQSNSDASKHDEIPLRPDDGNEDVLPSIEDKILLRREFRPSNFDPQKITHTQNTLLPTDYLSTSSNQQVQDRQEAGQDDEKSLARSMIEIEGQNLTLKNFTSSQSSLPTDVDTTKIHEDFNETDKRTDFNLQNPSDSVEINKQNIARSNFGPQELTLKKQSKNVYPEDVASRISASPTIKTGSESPELNELLDGLDKSLFFSFYNEMNDELLPQLDAAEQILYSRLFRLSYGFNRTYCTVSQPVLKEKTGLSRNTIRTGLQMLVQKEWVRILESGNHVSTTYRVILPREKNGRSLLDPQNLSPKNRRSNKYPHNLRGNNGSSEFAPPEAQKKDLQKMTLKDKKDEISSKLGSLPKRGSKFEAQKRGTLTITNNLLTLTQKESSILDIDNGSHGIFANQLLTHFYKKLRQEPSSAKWEKGLIECRQLLRDGFSVEQIESGIDWLLAHHPGTGSFSRVAHFIDQALKEKEKEQHESLLQQQKRLTEEEERLEAKRSIEESRQIELIKASLATEALAALREEALQFVDNEHGTPKYGRETLIQIKLNELIRVRFLSSSTE